MERTIKFRGKDSHSGEWFYGNLFVGDSRGRTHISTPEQGCFRINPESVGQFTGLLDKNGKEIYEGDIVEMGKYTGEVRWMPGKCCFQLSPGGVFLSRNCTVLGNIYDGYKLNENKE